MSAELIAKLESAVEYDTNGGCWLWTGYAYGRGSYLRGYVSVEGKSAVAARASFQVHTGVDPKGGMVCHKCDVSICINPDHLYLGDHDSNIADMVARKRSFGATQPDRVREIGRALGESNTWAKGEANPRVKLTEDQARSIAADTRKTKVLAEEYGVDRTTIQRIRRGSLWKA